MKISSKILCFITIISLLFTAACSAKTDSQPTAAIDTQAPDSIVTNEHESEISPTPAASETTSPDESAVTAETAITDESTMTDEVSVTETDDQPYDSSETTLNPYVITNKYLLNFFGKSNTLSELRDTLEIECEFFDSYALDSNAIDKTEYGDMGHFGEYWEKGFVSTNFGCSLTDEDMWYVSFQAPNPEESKLYEKYYFYFLTCLANNPIDMGETTDEIVDFISVVYDYIVMPQEDIAIQYNDYVFVYKNIPPNDSLFAVDSMPYFDAFYRDKIKFIPAE